MATRWAGTWVFSEESCGRETGHGTHTGGEGTGALFSPDELSFGAQSGKTGQRSSYHLVLNREKAGRDRDSRLSSVQGGGKGGEASFHPFSTPVILFASSCGASAREPGGEHFEHRLNVVPGKKTMRGGQQKRVLPGKGTGDKPLRGVGMGNITRREKSGLLFASVFMVAGELTMKIRACDVHQQARPFRGLESAMACSVPTLPPVSPTMRELRWLPMLSWCTRGGLEREPEARAPLVP